MFTFYHPLHFAFFFLNEVHLDTPKANYIHVTKINFGVAVPDVDGIGVEPVIFHFHWKPKRNLGFEAELHTFENELKITPQV